MGVCASRSPLPTPPPPTPANQNQERKHLKRSTLVNAHGKELVEELSEVQDASDKEKEAQSETRLGLHFRSAPAVARLWLTMYQVLLPKFDPDLGS